MPSPDKSRFYVSSETDNVLDVVERKSGKVIRHVPLGRRPNNVAIMPDGRRVYVCIREESWVDIVDTASLEKVKSVPVARRCSCRRRRPSRRSSWLPRAGGIFRA